MPDLTDVVPAPRRKLDAVVDHAATVLAGMEPDDQAAALAAGLEAVAEHLCEQRPELTDEQVRAVCTQLWERVQLRLAQFNAVTPSADAFN